jgi:Ca-activated chloride channel homolog
MPEWQFQYPEALWLLCLVPLIILLYLAYLRWRNRASTRIGEKNLVKRLYPSYSSRRATLKFALIVIAFFLGCIAVANPRTRGAASNDMRSGIDVVFALDVSNSMLATDVSPNRLAKAKDLIRTMIKQMPDNRIGLILFAGSAYVQVPPTFDHNMVEMNVRNSGPGTITAQGTAINDALKKSALALAGSEDRYQSIVLISDGESHDEDALETVKELSDEGILVNTVGIGSVGGSTIIDTATGRPRTDEGGQVVVSKLNEELLNTIAKSANGKYIHLNDVEQSARIILDQYSSANKKAFFNPSLFSYTSHYMWLVVPMLLLLLIELFLSERKKVKA